MKHVVITVSLQEMIAGAILVAAVSAYGGYFLFALARSYARAVCKKHFRMK